MIKKLIVFLTLFQILLLTACGDSYETAIENVNLIDVRTGEIHEGQYVYLENGRIAEIQSEALQAGVASTIDGTGKYLMPGLTEMHAHIPSPEWGRKDMNETLFLYLSNGITTIRGMLGHPVHLELRNRVENGQAVSPRVFTSSPSLNGNTVPSKEEARKKVRAYAADGYDFLKIHPGIKREVFDVIVETAREEDISFAGHVPVDVGIIHALESGYASIDHVDGFLEGLVPPSAGVDPAQNGFFGYNFTDLADTSRIPMLADLSREYQVWVVPTQSLFDRWFSPFPASQYLSEEEMKYMPLSIREAWESSKEDILQDPGYNQEQWEKFNKIRRQLIHELNESGHGLLLGSDAPQVFNVPGFSIHHEMTGMQQAGLSALEIIQAGTLNPASYFGMEGEFGEIVEGASADLILLRSNPLDDLGTLRNPEIIFYRGNGLTREEIDQRLAEIAQNASNE